MSQIDTLNEGWARLFPGLMGLKVTRAEPDLVEAELTVREDLCTTGQVLHGGAIMALADTVGAVGTMLNLKGGQGTTTLESKTNFFAAARLGETLTVRCTPLHRGRRTMVWQSNVSRADGRLAAQVTQTQMVLEA